MLRLLRVAGELTVKEAAALPRMLEQGQELGTPALLQAYRLLRQNPQLRQVSRSDSAEEDEPLLVARALYAFLHARAALHALPLAMEQLPSLDDSHPDNLAHTELAKRKHLLVCTLAQLLAREVLVDTTSSADSSATPHLHVQISSYVQQIHQAFLFVLMAYGQVIIGCSAKAWRVRVQANPCSNGWLVCLSYRSRIDARSCPLSASSP